MAQSCPIDSALVQKDKQVLALYLFEASPVLFDLNSLDALPQSKIITERRNQIFGSTNAVESQETIWGGVLLKDFLLKAGLESVPSRSLRNTRIELLATDGYRALFSWGEVFNSPAGSQILFVTKQNGSVLDVQEGPIALRALGDIRPGARHVRNLCAVSLRN